MPCLLASLNKKRGFVIIEVLFAALIGTLLVVVLFYTLNSGEIINDLSSAKVLSQSKARRLSDWITCDLHQAVVWDLANNSPSSTHLKFRPVLGWNITGDTYQLDTNYIEYVYDAGVDTLTRNLLNSADVVLKSWVFSDVVGLPFFTRDGSGNLIALDNSIGTSKKVVSVITVTKISRKGEALTVSLTAETKIRNE